MPGRDANSCFTIDFRLSGQPRMRSMDTFSRRVRSSAFHTNQKWRADGDGKDAHRCGNGNAVEGPRRRAPFTQHNGSEAELRRGPVGGRLSGTTLAATNDVSVGSVCKRRDAATLGKKKGLQPRANERPAGSFSFKLGRGRSFSHREIRKAHARQI